MQENKCRMAWRRSKLAATMNENLAYRSGKLAATMEPWADRIFSATPDDLHKLYDKNTMLHKLSTLDPNWKSFNRFEMMEVFRSMAEAHNDSQRSYKLVQMAEKRNITIRELLQIYAYKLRIMLAYYNNYCRPTPKPSRVCSDSRKDPPPKRVRKNVEDEEQEFKKYALFEKDALEKMHQPFLVNRYFDRKTFEAMELFSNGKKEKADSYTQGPTGFAIARFKDYNMVLKVPNTCVLRERRLVQHQSKVVEKSKSKSKGQAQQY